MGDLHFSLADLPERYKRQVVSQLFPSGIKSPAKKPTESVSPRTPSTTHPKARNAPQRILGGFPRETDGVHKMSHPEKRFRSTFAPSMGWEVVCYEPLSIWISGGFRYTPDFLIRDSRGNLAFVEVKGSYKLPSHGRARLAFADASTKTPNFDFYWATEARKKSRGFILELWRAGRRIRKP